jgi:hypothetical protein
VSSIKPTPALWAAWIAVVVALPAFSAPATRSAEPRPIEVEVVQGMIPCAPAESFEAGFRSVLGQRQLTVMDANNATRVIPNAFCFATERPSVKPLHVSVRIQCDRSMIVDYFRPVPDAVSESSHWLVHVVVPFRVIRGAPGARQRTSYWARVDRKNYCESMGRAVALCVLEKLNRESGMLRTTESVDLGPDVRRDKTYSESGDDWWAQVRSDLTLALPMLVVWGTIMLIAFALVRLLRGIWRRAVPSARSR